MDSLCQLKDDARLYGLLNSTYVLGDTDFYKDQVFGAALDRSGELARMVDRRLYETFQASRSVTGRWRGTSSSNFPTTSWWSKTGRAWRTRSSHAFPSLTTI